MPKVRFALIQSSVHPEPRIQIEKTFLRIQSAAEEGAKIICLEELFLHPYFPSERNKKHFDRAEEIPGKLTRIACRAAKENRVVLIVPMFEKDKRSGHYFNSVLVIGPKGEVLGKYRKVHIPDDPGYGERFYFTAGNLGFPVFETPYGKIAVLICWDQWFPEAARAAALGGAQIIFYPTAIGYLKGDHSSTVPDQLESWITVQRAHAITNGCYVAAVNRVGHGAKIRFWGNSFAVDPFGKILVRGDDKSDQILTAEYDSKRVQSVREEWRFLKDRRPGQYTELIKSKIQNNKKS